MIENVNTIHGTSSLISGSFVEWITVGDLFHHGGAAGWIFVDEDDLHDLGELAEIVFLETAGRAGWRAETDAAGDGWLFSVEWNAAFCCR